MINRKALFLSFLMMSIGFIFSFKVVLAKELSFIKNNPTLEEKLLTREKESSETLKVQIRNLREDDAIGKTYAAIKIGKHPETSQGSILALIETLKDSTGLQWGGRLYFRYNYSCGGGVESPWKNRQTCNLPTHCSLKR